MGDPDFFQFLESIATENDAIQYAREHGLIPAPVPPPPVPVRADRGINEYWGVCRDLGFNPMQPNCHGRVTTVIRYFRNGSKPQFRCVRCRKQLSQLNGVPPLNPAAQAGTWFAVMDRGGSPTPRLRRGLFFGSPFAWPRPSRRRKQYTTRAARCRG